jgi:hypothetical protein
MTVKERAFFLAVAIPGLLGSVVAVSRFLFEIHGNQLGWRPDQSPRDYYLALGSAYSHGFGAGFFLCFFLVLVAVAVSAGPKDRGRQRGPRQASRLGAPEGSLPGDVGA